MNQRPGVTAVEAAVKAQGVPVARDVQHQNRPAWGLKATDPGCNDAHIGPPDRGVAGRESWNPGG